MGFSLIAEGLLKTYLPAADWQVLVNSFGYSFGFLIVLLGKQQLFTENTLTPVLPLLHRKDFSTFVHVARLWGVVLLANLLGTLVFSLALAYSPAFSAEVVQSFKEIGDKAMEPDFAGILVRGIFASWLIALMVWLLPAAKAAKVLVIILITYLISIAHFSHVIAGSVEVFTLAALGGTSWLNALANYILPSLIGNVIGGVVLVALLNFAQVAANKKDK
jgi:formate/nitrite transporter FocA (FNT family)